MYARGSAVRTGRSLAVALCAALALASAAQAQRGREEVVVSGRVFDAATGAPLKGAVVEVAPARRWAATDSSGAFLVRLRPGDYLLVVTQLGYADQRSAIRLAPGAEAAEVAVAMTSEPVMLEAVEVVADRFETRRHLVPLSSRRIARDRLVRGAGNLTQVVRSAGMMFATPCDGAVSSSIFATSSFPSPRGLYCIYRRGQVVAPAVYIDDRLAYGGMFELDSYLPADVHHVEVYGMGMMVRVYTLGYVESLARGRSRLPPMFW
jgi:hypothetical protein